MNKNNKKKENLSSSSTGIKRPEDNKKSKSKKSTNKKHKQNSVNSENNISNLNENDKPKKEKILENEIKDINNNLASDKNNNLAKEDSKKPLNEKKEFPKNKNWEKLKISYGESLQIFSKMKNSYSSKKGKIFITNFFINNMYEKNNNLIKSDNIIIINNKNPNMGQNSKEPPDKAKIFKDLEDNNKINTETNPKKSEIYINDNYYNKKEGFHNFGTTCYMNSFLQILIHVPGLIEQLMEYKNKIYKNSLLYYLLEIADKPSKDNLYDLRKAFMQKNSSYKYYQQEDSQEFGAELLKGINKELSDLEYFILGWKIEEGFNLKNIDNKNLKIKLDKLKDLLINEGSDFQYQTIINYFFYYYETTLIICNNKVVDFKYYGDVDNQLAFEKGHPSVYSINLTDMLKKKYLFGNN